MLQESELKGRTAAAAPLSSLTLSAEENNTKKGISTKAYNQHFCQTENFKKPVLLTKR